MKNQVWRRCLMVSCGLSLLLASTAGNATPMVIPVPYRSHDPSIPHPAYNGHPTTFKAISRGDCENVYFRWDTNGDGTWDSCDGKAFAQPIGKWHLGNRYVLDCRAQLPEQDPSQITRHLFVATVQASCSVDSGGNPGASTFASYPVLVTATVPRGRSLGASSTYAYSARPISASAVCSTTCATTGFPCSADADCVGDDDASLAIKREVAIDDALWFLHKLLTRTGEGTNTITASIRVAAPGHDDEGAYMGSSANYLQLLSLNGHLPAYPPGTYSHNPSSYGDVPSLSPSWTTLNNFRYNVDPYAEDGARLLNYLLGRLVTVAVDVESEENDSNTAIVGTDNSNGLHTGDVNETNGQVLAALAVGGMGGTSAQVGVSQVVGHSLEYVAQEQVDLLCYWQIRAGQSGATDATRDNGTWGYNARGTFNGEMSHFSVLGLATASAALSSRQVIVPANCKNRVADSVMNVWQCSDGGGRYMPGEACANPEETGAALLAHAWLFTNQLPNNSSQNYLPQSSKTNADLLARYQSSLTFLATNWSSSTLTSGHWIDPAVRFNGTGQGIAYTQFSIGTALRALSPPVSLLTGSIDWARDYAYYFINNQKADGQVDALRNVMPPYENTNYYSPVPARTARLALVQTPVLGSEEPVAIPDATPTSVLEGCTGGQNGKITFAHFKSYHPSPTQTIVDYQWIFDVAEPVSNQFNTVNWAGLPNGGYSADGKAFHTNSRDATPVFTFNQTGTYRAALRVVDSAMPQKTNLGVISQLVVTAQAEMSPTCGSGGPYNINYGEDLHLAGSMDDLNFLCRSSENLHASWFLNDSGGTPAADFSSASGTVAWSQLAALDPPLLLDAANNIWLAVTDATSRTATCASTLIINDTRPKPCYAVADSYSTDEDSSLVTVAPGVLGNDLFDVQDTTHTAVLVSGPLHGAVELAEDGSFVYSPFEDFNGVDSFTYRAATAFLSSEEPAQVVVQIQPVNDAPVFTSVPPTIATVGVPMIYHAVASDADLADTPADQLAFSIPTAPDGMNVDSITGEISWTPSEVHAGQLVSVTVAVFDQASASATQTFAVLVDALPEPEPEPEPGDGDEGTGEESPPPQKTASNSSKRAQGCNSSGGANADFACVGALLVLMRVGFRRRKTV